MTSFLLSLHAIDQLIERYPSRDPEGRRLLQVIRQLTPTTQDLKASQGFSTEQVIKTFFENAPPSSIANQASTLEAVREALNKHLLKMLDENSNPAGILIGDGFSFFQLKRHKFKPSELAFRLPETLHKEIREKVDLLNDQHEEEERRLQALQQKEDSLIQTQSEMEEKDSEFRKSHTKQFEQLKTDLDQQQKKYEEEVSRLRQEISHLQDKQLTHQSVQEDRLKEDIQERIQLDHALKEQFHGLESHQEEFAAMIKKLCQQEADFLKLKKRERQRVKKRELYLKKSTEAHLERIQAWDQRITEINQAESLRRRQQEQEFKKTLQELQQDFKRQLLHFQLQANEGAERSRKLEEERQQIMIRKQALSGEIQSRTESFLKKRQSDLAQKETSLLKSLDQATHFSTLLNMEKSKWLDLVKSDEGTLYTRAELESLVQDQEKLTRKLTGLLDSFNALKKEEESILKNRQFELDTERKELYAEVQQERETLMESIERLNQREESLIERETQELARLHEDYEDLRLSLEVNLIEKGEQLDEKESGLLQREAELQALFREYQEANKLARKEWIEQEGMIQSELENLLSTKLEQDTQQVEARNFLNDLKSTFEHRLALQKNDFDRFEQDMKIVKDDAERIKETLEKDAESSYANKASLEQSLEEGIKHHQVFMENLEEDLRNRVKFYSDQNIQLRESREDLQKSERQTIKSFLENLSNYDQRLKEIGRAFEELSDTYTREQALGGLQLETVPPPEPSKQIDEGFSEDRAQDEWDHLLHKFSRLRDSSLPEIQPRYLDEWSKHWDQWISIEPGEFLMGYQNHSDALPQKRTHIDYPLRVSRYPVTNVEFMRFVLQTSYRTEAEIGQGGIVYFSGLPVESSPSISTSSTPTLESLQGAAWWCPDGSPETLKNKFNHPVTLVSWNDVNAYCQWKSEQLERPVRLPTETEWEYLACNLGEFETDLPWNFEEGLQHCNLEESRIGDTTAVDHFPEHNQTGGVLDLFGNVYEWVLDGPPPIGRSADLDYKLARGGGYLTRFQQVARWRRLAFLSTYRTSFIGFRIVTEENDHVPT